MAGLTLIVMLLVLVGLRNLNLRKSIELEGTGKRVNFQGHLKNTKVLLKTALLVGVFVQYRPHDLFVGTQ